MDRESPVSIELRQLFDAVCDEIATPAQVEELERRLRADPSLGRAYANYCRLHVELHFAIRAQKMAERAMGAIREPDANRQVAASPTMKSAAAPTGAPPKSPVLGFLGGAIDYVNHSRMLMFWIVAAAVGGWFAFQIGSLVVDRSRARNAQVAGGASNQGSPDNSGQDLPDRNTSHLPGGSFVETTPPRGSDPVASITANVDCHWRVVASSIPPGPAPAPGDADALQKFPVGTELAVGKQYELVNGLAEITFQSGAKVVLNGPARFTVGSPLGAKLNLGKLTAKVPHDAHGFTIDTPSSKVVDLGTEFGVAVAADASTIVDVFAGRVSVDSLSGGQGLGSLQQVTAGHAVKVELGKPAEVVPHLPNRFVVGLGPREDPKKAQGVYLDWVRSLKPIVWFRMEGDAKDRVLHDEMGGPDAKLVWDGPGNPFVEGSIGKSLWLRGGTLHDYAILPNYPQAEHDKLTVSAWVYARSRPQWAFIVGNWHEVWPKRGQFVLGLHGLSAKPLYVGFTERDGTEREAVEDAAHPFPLNEWQHVALVTDGSTMRLYREGREVARAQHHGLMYPVSTNVLSVGAYQGKPGEEICSRDPCLWDGRVDEVAIFNDALSGDEIRTLAAAPP